MINKNYLTVFIASYIFFSSSCFGFMQSSEFYKNLESCKPIQDKYGYQIYGMENGKCHVYLPGKVTNTETNESFEDVHCYFANGAAAQYGRTVKSSNELIVKNLTSKTLPKQDELKIKQLMNTEMSLLRKYCK